MSSTRSPSHRRALALLFAAAALTTGLGCAASTTQTTTAGTTAGTAAPTTVRTGATTDPNKPISEDGGREPEDDHDNSDEPSSEDGGRETEDGGRDAQDTITVDDVVDAVQKQAAKNGLDAEGAKCITDYIEEHAPSGPLTEQQGIDLINEGTTFCSDLSRQGHEIIVGPTSTLP